MWETVVWFVYIDMYLCIYVKDDFLSRWMKLFSRKLEGWQETHFVPKQNTLFLTKIYPSQQQYSVLKRKLFSTKTFNRKIHHNTNNIYLHIAYTFIIHNASTDNAIIKDGCCKFYRIKQRGVTAFVVKPTISKGSHAFYYKNNYMFGGAEGNQTVLKNY